MKQSRLILFVSFLTLVWMTLALSLYYAGHKPFSPPAMLHVVAAAGQFMVSLLVISLAGGLGRRLIRSNECNTLAILALQSAVGLGLISIGIFIIGSVIGVKVILCWIIAILLAILLWRDTLAWLAGWKELIKFWTDSGRFGKALGVGILLLLLCTLVISLAPPLKFDALGVPSRPSQFVSQIR